MNLWLARDLDPGPPPEPAGHVLAGLDPTSSSGKHDQRGQHRDRRKEADSDGDRQGRTDGLEDAESGEGETEERDGDRACGAGDHRADRAECGDQGIVGRHARAQTLVVTAEQEDGVVGSRAEHHPGHQHERLGSERQSDQAEPGHHLLCHDQGHPDRGQRQEHRHHVAVHDDQDRQNHQHGGDLDDVLVLGTDLGQIFERGGGADHVGSERRVGGRRLDVLDDVSIRPLSLSGAHRADEADRNCQALLSLLVIA